MKKYLLGLLILLITGWMIVNNSSSNNSSDTSLKLNDQSPSSSLDSNNPVPINTIESNNEATSSTVKINIPLSIEHKGFTYNIITSPITGKKWLDRNLGATKVCTKSRDDISFSKDEEYISSQNSCFGDLYQWGRSTDGHEKSNSSITSKRSNSISEVGSSFIITADSPYDWVQNISQDKNAVDEDGLLRMAQWSKTDGTSICPVGFRVPTSTEIYSETTSYTGIENEKKGAIKVTNRNTAFKNFLKFPVSRYRFNGNGSLYYNGSHGVVWANSVDGSSSKYMNFNSQNADEDWYNRAYAFSVRCIKN